MQLVLKKDIEEAPKRSELDKLDHKAVATSFIFL